MKRHVWPLHEMLTSCACCRLTDVEFGIDILRLQRSTKFEWVVLKPEPEHSYTE